MPYNIQTNYAYHIIRGHAEGFKPLTEEQFRAIADKMIEETREADTKLTS
jgi:hypothetical protein